MKARRLCRRSTRSAMARDEAPSGSSDRSLPPERRNLLGELQGRGVTILLCSCHRLLGDGDQLFRCAGVDRRDRLRWAFDDLSQNCERRGLAARRYVRWSSGEDRVENRPERIDVRRRIHLLHVAGGLLGRHEHRSTGNRAGGSDERVLRIVALFTAPAAMDRGQWILAAETQSRGVPILGPDDLREPPVHDVRFAERADTDVVRLEVAVDNALRMSERDRLRDAGERAEHPGDSVRRS